MSRRETIGNHTFDAGYSDRQGALSGNPNQWSNGSCNQFLLGENLIRPFRGYYTQGTGTGSRLMFPLGSTWGGLRDYSTVTASGSLLEDYSKTLFTIGSGEVTKQGIPVAEDATDFTFAPGDVTLVTGTIVEASHGLLTGDVIYLTCTTAANDRLPLSLSTSTAYFVIAVTTNTFRLASTFKNALAGTAIANVGDTGQGTFTLLSDSGGTITVPSFGFADVTVGTGTITTASHGLTTGDPWRFSNSGGDPPDGWTENTGYFAIVISSSTYRIATSYSNALAGTQVIPIDAGTGTNTVVAKSLGSPIRSSSVLQVGYNQVATYFYEYVENAGLPQADAPVVALPTGASSGYTGTVNGAVNFKIAAMRDYQNYNVDIDNPAAPVRGLASTASAVVLPTNNTVEIQFPAAVSGQTHWAVFSTKEGFGGTGEFYRLGYRTSSDANAVWYFGISEQTVQAATGRTLEFDYRTGDLLPELAWIEDYEPPPASHCVRLENIMVVLGAYDGTVGAVSLPNYFESYNPFHLLYFAEPVTAVLARQIDNFAFVACRNSIHTIQYVGYRGSELPSATITTITPEVGIAHHHNWCMGAGQIAMFIEGAGIALMGNDGQIDFEFGREVASFTSSWLAADTKVTFNPTTRSFVFGNGNSSVSYCLESGAWGAPVYNSDAGVVSNWLSGINAQGKLYMSMSSGTAYIYDDATDTTRMLTANVGSWISRGTGRGNAIYELGSAVRGSTNVEPCILGVHKNLFPTFQRSCSVTSASAVLTGAFTTNYTGIWAAVFGTDIGGAGVHYLIVRLTYVSPTTATMANPVTGASVPAQASASNMLVLTGAYFTAITPVSAIDQHLRNARPAMQDCRSYCASLVQPTNALTGGCYQIELFGRPHQTSAIGVTG